MKGSEGRGRSEQEALLDERPGMATPPELATQPRVDSAPHLALGRRERLLILLTGDLLTAGLSLALALWLGGLRSGWDWSTRSFGGELAAWLALLLPLWLALAWANDLYDLGRVRDRWETAWRPLVVGAQLLVLWALAYFVPPPWTLVRHVAVFFALLSALAIGAWRLAYARLLAGGGFRRRLLILGAGRSGRALLAAIREHAGHLIEVPGFVDDDPDLQGLSIDGLPVVADRQELLSSARALQIGELALAVHGPLHPELFGRLMDLREQGIALTPMPLLFESITGRVPVEHVGEQWAMTLPLSSPDSDPLDRLGRRALDGVFGILGLALLTLLLPPMALAIRLDSPGPVFYRQIRLGRGGRPFTLYKLRSMIADAEPEGAIWSPPGDPRVTRVGRWLRSSRLDELPQAWNILRGDMSLIGPRPERPELVEALARRIPYYRARHALRPGLTGWATVRLGYAAGEDDALRKLEHDLYYIKHRSLLLDLRILLMTAGTVLRLRGR